MRDLAVPNDGGAASDRRLSNEHLMLHKFPCASANLYTPSQDSLRAKFRWDQSIMLGALPPTFLRIDSNHSSPYVASKVLNNVSESRSEPLSSALLQQV